MNGVGATVPIPHFWPMLTNRHQQPLTHVRRGYHRRFQVLLKVRDVSLLVNFSSAQGNRARSHFMSTQHIQDNRHCHLSHSFVRTRCPSYRTS
jgi:hypothetical protein